MVKTNVEKELVQENFSELMKEYDLKSPVLNEPVEGKIVEITDDKVVIDIGGKSEGILSKEEILDAQGNLKHKEGDLIKVICKKVNKKQGYITVTKKELDDKESWFKVKNAYEEKETIKGTITGMNNDGRGFTVDCGVDMFLPISQLDIRRIKNPEKFVGNSYDFTILKLNKKEQRGVISRRKLMEQEREVKLNEFFDKVQIGDKVEGKVVRIEDDYAIVGLNIVDARLEKEDITYGRLSHPREKLRRGFKSEFVVLDFSKENRTLRVGLKQLSEDPWVNIEEKYPIGHRLVAKVTKIVDFGAFIKLEEDVEGLLHASDLTWEGRPKNVEEFVAVGEEMWVQVIEVNKKEKRIKLGLKQLELRPEERYMESKKKGDVVEGKVKKVLPNKVVVTLEADENKSVEGIIKISDIAYFRIDSTKDFFKVGDEIKAVISKSSLDRNYKILLSTKELSDNEWSKFNKEHNKGDLIEVVIKKVNESGLNVAITKNIEGFIRLSEVSKDKIEPEELVNHYSSGDKVEAAIQSIQLDKNRVYLSIKAVAFKKEREEIEKYGRSEPEQVTTIGDLFQNALDKDK